MPSSDGKGKSSWLRRLQDMGGNEATGGSPDRCGGKVTELQKLREEFGGEELAAGVEGG